MPLPMSERGYPHPELLAETDWLASRLSDPTVRIVDARSDEDYAGGHIPGAVHINGFSLGGIRPGSEMPEPEAFARLAGALGIDESTTVVVYDAGRSQMAGWLPGRSSTTAIPIPVTSMVGWRSGPPRGCRFPATSRPTNRGRSQLAW